MARKNVLSSDSKKHYTKEELYQKQLAEKKLVEMSDGSITALDAPANLTEIALDEFHRITSLIGDLPLSKLDVVTLAQYCEFYQLYVLANEDVKENGTTIYELNVRGEKIKKINPSFKIMMDASNRMQKLANDLGMTLNGRLQILNTADIETKVVDDFAKYN